MDIVSRLKKFISYLAVPVTQFADNCSIPRPTLSQLLNGRNKKVSDEFIGKIHETYPQLSVLWLMFGEGDMIHSANNEISTPKEASIFDFSNEQHSDRDDIEPQSIDFDTHTTGNTNKSLEQTSTILSDNIDPISFNTSDTKKIVNIIIYYNDNSFESFIPNK